MWLRMAFLSVAIVFATSTVRAQDEGADASRCVDFGADDAEVSARIADVRSRIAHHEPDMRHWSSAWLTVFGTLIGVELALLFTATNDGARVDAVVSTLGLVLGLTTQLATFPPLIGAGGTLDAMPESTPDERVRKLVAGETLLRRSAEAVGFAQGWTGPVLSGVYSIAANTVVLAGYQRTTGAYLGAIGGVVIGQGRIITLPYGIAREWRTYQAAHADAGCSAPALAAAAAALDWRLLPGVTMGGAGLTFGLTF